MDPLLNSFNFIVASTFAKISAESIHLGTRVQTSLFMFVQTHM
jgi:hypothetical protein